MFSVSVSSYPLEDIVTTQCFFREKKHVSKLKVMTKLVNKTPVRDMYPFAMQLL
jgi:hypothetical protein